MAKRRRKRSEAPKRVPVPDEVLDVLPEQRERVRLALVEIARRQQKLTLRALRETAGTDQNATSKILRAYRAKRMPPLFQPWDEAADPEAGSAKVDTDSQEREALVELLERSSTEEDLDELNKRVSMLLAAGAIDYQVANAFKQLLAERRLVLKAKREVPSEDPELQFTLTAAGCTVARAFERICCDERRQRVVDYVVGLLEEDLRELPAVDPMGAL